MTTTKTRPVRTGKPSKPAAAQTAPVFAAAAPVVEAPKVTKREMATPEPRPMHVGTASSTYRVGKKLTALRTDYKCGTMSEKDTEFLRDVVDLAGTGDTIERRNIDAGRLGRLFTLGFVTYEETGVVDSKQIITVLPKAKDFLRPVRAA